MSSCSSGIISICLFYTDSGHPVFPQIWIYGNSFESFLVAVVNPNKEALEKWAQDNGVSGDFNSICENPKAKEFIIGELTKTGKEKKVSSYIAYAETLSFFPLWHLSNTWRFFLCSWRDLSLLRRYTLIPYHSIWTATFSLLHIRRRGPNCLNTIR